MWQEILKNVENEKCTLQDLEYGKESKNQESETQTLQDLECGEKFSKRGK